MQMNDELQNTSEGDDSMVRDQTPQAEGSTPPPVSLPGLCGFGTVRTQKFTRFSKVCLGLSQLDSCQRACGFKAIFSFFFRI